MKNEISIDLGLEDIEIIKFNREKRIFET